MKSASEIAGDMLRWRVSFVDFLFDCVKTTDEGCGEVLSAPRLRYLAETHEVIEGNKTTIVVKGRQMFYTHFMSARFLWKLLFYENVRLGVMNQSEEDAVDILETRIKPLYERLPEGYPWPALVFKRLIITNPLLKGRVVAGASTSNKQRGKTFTEIWLDEFGFQENQGATLKAALPAVNGPMSKLIIVSTPNPKTVYEELARKELDPGFEVIERMEGVREMRNMRGHAVLYIHHSAHPGRRSEEWVEATRKEHGDLAYEVEYNLNWVLPSGKPVFKGYDRVVYTRDYRRVGVLEGVDLEEGWDFGAHHPAWVCGQRDGVGRLILHKGVMGVDEDLYAFVDRIDEIRAREFPGMDFNLYCDPAGKNRSGQGTASPAQELLSRHYRKPVRSIYSKPADRVRAVKALMSKIIEGTPGVIMHPMLGEAHYSDGSVESGVMIEGFESGLVYDEVRGNQGVYKLSYKKDQWYEHLMDAFGYMFIYLYPGLMPSDFEERFRKRERVQEMTNKRLRGRRRQKFRR